MNSYRNVDNSLELMILQQILFIYELKSQFSSIKVYKFMPLVLRPSTTKLLAARDVWKLKSYTRI